MTRLRLYINHCKCLHLTRLCELNQGKNWSKHNSVYRPELLIKYENIVASLISLIVHMQNAYLKWQHENIGLQPHQINYGPCKHFLNSTSPITVKWALLQITPLFSLFLIKNVLVSLEVFPDLSFTTLNLQAQTQRDIKVAVSHRRSKRFFRWDLCQKKQKTSDSMRWRPKGVDHQGSEVNTGKV